jgi:ubiquinone/menaquinone biosynthesis C-methylase UbiE
VRRFAYVLDPLCLACCALYALNRWLIKPHCHILFFHAWFNDTLLIPCALPPLLMAHRWLGLRSSDEPPTALEIGAHVIGWSVLFEVIGPHIMPTTGDPWDAVAYTVGAIVAWWWWRRFGGFKMARGKTSFDKLARHYRWMEGVLAGSKIQRCRTAFLQSIPSPQRVLLVGEGNGRFLVELLRVHPKAHCVCVDSSPAMLAEAQARLRASGLGDCDVQFVKADLLDWTPLPGRFDLVVTHFVLDCFEPGQLDRVVAQLAESAAPGAHWLLADFGEPSSGVAKWRARLILDAMYLFFHSVTRIPATQLTAPNEVLKRHGFVLRQQRSFEWGLLHSDLWELTRAV